MVLGEKLDFFDLLTNDQNDLTITESFSPKCHVTGLHLTRESEKFGTALLNSYL